MEDKYLISEDQLIAIEMILKQSGIPMKRNVLLTEIRNTSLIAERKEILTQITAILDRRKVCMEDLYKELRDPAVAKHSLQQIEIIRYHIDKLLGEPYD